MYEILFFIITIGILVTFHEYGHFWVARKCGVKVLRFSIGFGQPLIKWKDKQGTEYWIATIPLGGYVKMLDEREGNVDVADRSSAFNNKSVWKRMAIVAAGPAANFILAVVVFWGIFMSGETGIKPIILTVEPESIAAKAQLEAGMEIVAIDGRNVRRYQELNENLFKRIGDSGVIEFTVRHPDSSLAHKAEAPIDGWLGNEANPNPLKSLGIQLYTPPGKAFIGEVTPDSPALAAGLMVGDRLVAADGLELERLTDWYNLFRQSPEETIQLSVEREGKRLDLEVVPERLVEKGVAIGRIGVRFDPQSDPWPDDMLVEISYNPVSALWQGVHKTYSSSGMILESMLKIVTGKISAKNLSGPVTIAKVAGASAKQGLVSYLKLLALLSVMLGVMNLLPIPVLDGGHLLYFSYEAIVGKPLSEKIQLMGFQVGAALLFGVMMLALYNDFVH